MPQVLTASRQKAQSVPIIESTVTASRDNMFRTSFRRSSRYRYIRAAFIIVFLLSFVDICSLILSHSQQPPSPNLKPLSHPQKIYISSIHWNNEAILRSHWIEAAIDLAKFLGPDRVYISVYESGSWDDSKGALRLLDSGLEKLGFNRSIILDEVTHVNEIEEVPAATGWIDTPRNRKELRRIPYLSKLRNISLEPLAKLAQENITFDKILFLNDVVFTVRS